MTTTRDKWWMAAPDDERKIVSALWAAEAMARDRDTVMALTGDLKVKPVRHTVGPDVLEVIRCDR